LGQIWTNSNVGVRTQLKNLQFKVKVEVGLKFEMTFLTQFLGLSIFYPNLGSNNQALLEYMLNGQNAAMCNSIFKHDRLEKAEYMQINK